MIALIILGAVLLLFVLLLITPVRLEVKFREEFILTVRYLFLRFRILPGKEGEPEQQPVPEEEPESESGLGKLKAIFQREGFGGFLRSLLEFIELVGKSSKRLLSHVKCRRFDLYLRVAGTGDAAETAVLYGEISAGVYSACGILFGLMPCRKKAVTVDLDYQAGENMVDFWGKVSILPLFALKEGLAVLVKGLPFLKKMR